MNIEIMDDFLPSHYNDYYKNLLSNDQSTISSPFSWYFVDELNEKKYKGNFYFSNCCYDVAASINNLNEVPLYEPLLNKLGITMSNVKRIKTNLYPLSGHRIHHETHIDYTPNRNLRTCLYYINDSNRLTIFDGKKRIKCKNNRAILFDGSMPHHSTTPTNVNYACSVNIDYWL